METRARFVLIGLLTLISLLAALGFTLWLAKLQIDRTYAQYDIVFESVAGLGQASAVRYNGVDVGKVLTIALDRDDPSKVRVRIEVAASTPVRVDTVATLASQGVTGVSFVALEGGSTQSALLTVDPPADVPEITSKNSVVQDLIGNAPDLLAEAIALMEDVRGFTTPENREAIAAILQDVQSVTGRIDALTGRAEATLAAAEATLARVDQSLASVDGLTGKDIPALLAQADRAVEKIGTAAASIDGYAQRDLDQITAQIGSLVSDARSVTASLDALVRKIANDPGRFLLGTQTPEYRR